MEFDFVSLPVVAPCTYKASFFHRQYEGSNKNRRDGISKNYICKIALLYQDSNNVIGFKDYKNEEFDLMCGEACHHDDNDTKVKNDNSKLIREERNQSQPLEPTWFTPPRKDSLMSTPKSIGAHTLLVISLFELNIRITTVPSITIMSFITITSSIIIISLK
ncbi:hypothetical protein EDC94DRAFT_673041 [Helicostylum pulchrum]|nr:hypothetical protein EDC94DRAFT_673041 [Helicostylum pulchrum]